MNIAEEAAKILREREATHGNIVDGMQNLGYYWTGILRDYMKVPLAPLPAHIVGLMLAAMKMTRAARHQHHDSNVDDYIDMHNYITGATDFLWPMDHEPQPSGEGNEGRPSDAERLKRYEDALKKICREQHEHGAEAQVLAAHALGLQSPADLNTLRCPMCGDTDFQFNAETNVCQCMSCGIGYDPKEGMLRAVPGSAKSNA